MIVFLTKRAEKNFQTINNYISKEWGLKVAEAFEQKIIDFLELLKEFPKLGSIEVPDKLIFGFQLTKHTKVFYRIKKNRIIILSFFDVRQDPKKKPK